MTSINRLPKEVLQQVFSFVGDKDSLMNCSIVCKKWRESATQEVYEDLTLEAYHIYKLKKLFEKNDPKQDVYFKQLHWTKKLKIKEDNLYSLKSQMIKLEQTEFEKFMSYIPKLEKFNIKETRNKSHYSTLLCNIDSATYLKRLEQICGLTLEACYNCYATLTHLVFSYSENATITIDGEEKDLPGLLPNFECLTHLWFWTGSQEVTMTDLSLLCPKLLSLAFYSDHIDISEESLNKTLAKMDEQKQVVNTINQNIKELDLHLSNLSSKYINLIT